MSEEIKIDKDVPMPEDQRNSGKWKRAWANMKPGDSILVPKKNRTSLNYIAVQDKEHYGHALSG